MPLPYKEVYVNTNFVFSGIITTKTCTHIHIFISRTSYTVWFSVSKSREGELNTNHKVEKGVAIVVQDTHAENMQNAFEDPLSPLSTKVDIDVTHMVKYTYEAFFLHFCVDNYSRVQVQWLAILVW